MSARAAWLALHLVYHGDRDRLLAGAVLPAVAALRREGRLRRFFFVRYTLGGPHVRLRLELRPGDAGRAREVVRAHAERFFRLHPSTAAVDGEAVRRENRAVLAGDPLAAGDEDLVYPDNAVVEAPMVLEVERYGGPALVDRSVDFFAVSSAGALRWVAQGPGRPAGQRLAAAARVLARQARGFAPDGAAFTELLGYGVRFLGEALPAAVAHGDEAFERAPAPLVALVSSAAHPDAAELDAAAARRLAREVAGLPDDRRWAVCASQLHMSANRLGLLNVEEVYLCRMLWRAARAAAEADPAAWRGGREDRPAGRLPALGRLAARALDALAGGAAAAGAREPGAG